MKRTMLSRTLAGILLGLSAGQAVAQKAAPHIGYIYPAGGQQGQTVEVTIGGQYLQGVTNVYVTGEGVEAEVIQYVRALKKKEMNDLNKEMREVAKKRQEAKKKGEDPGGKDCEELPADIRELDIASLSLKSITEIRKQLYNPKLQPNSQIADRAIVRLTFAPKAVVGERKLRVATKQGMSNPMVIQVGALPEQREQEPNDRQTEQTITRLPATMNGQIMPGDVDRFRIVLKKDTRLVIAVQAQSLVPYLADAVPGWFQATLALYGPEGEQVAFVDDYRFLPDPVMRYTVPEDGEYALEIRDSIYRGRQDFVYRIEIGELPYVTGVFPLGGPAGRPLKLQLTGWNLASDTLELSHAEAVRGVHQTRVSCGPYQSNPIVFAVDTLPEVREKEPNNFPRSAQPVKMGVTVNGRINRAGDLDVFKFNAKAGDELVAEVRARRLQSPLDSVLRITDAQGREIAVNDDFVDKGEGLVTHHADSYISAKLPRDGVYYVHLTDTRRDGSEAHGYRLRLSRPQPDFALRIVPSCINVFKGDTKRVTLYALRKDGFEGDITVDLGDAPGFSLSGNIIPEGQEKIEMTLTAAPTLPDEPMQLQLTGSATVDGEVLTRPVVAAEDVMQAFLYRHLVAEESFSVAELETKWPRKPLVLQHEGIVPLPVGEVVKLRFKTPWRKPRPDMVLELTNPPDGVTLKKVTPGPFSYELELALDAEKVKPGLRGNLMTTAYREFIPKGKDGKPRSTKKQRRPMGLLPAVPFAVVAADQ